MPNLKDVLLNTTRNGFRPPSATKRLARAPEAPKVELTLKDMEQAVINKMTNWQRSKYQAEAARRQKNNERRLKLTELAEYLRTPHHKRAPKEHTGKNNHHEHKGKKDV